MVSKDAVVALDSKVETCQLQGYGLLSVMSGWCFNGFVKPNLDSRACMTHGLIGASVSLEPYFVQNWKCHWKQVLVNLRRIYVFSLSPACISCLRLSSPLLGRAALGLLVTASRFLWNFPWLPSSLIHLWQLPLQSCSAFSPPYKAFWK